jgi:hypothetical protein
MKNMTTSERIENLRKERIKSSENKIVKLLKKISKGLITLYDDDIWESFKNSILYDSELIDFTPINYINYILEEYEKNSQMAKIKILNLAKDPLRQNISEEVQEIIAREKGFLTNKLPQSGKNSLRIFNGEMKRTYQLTEQEKELSSKALDFEFYTELGDRAYTYNKYNKWVGGSTDDVYNDVRHLIDNYKKIKNNTTKLLIILDGHYWDLNRNKLQLHQSENLIITSSDELNLSFIKY